MNASFAVELERFGPDQNRQPTPSAAAARAYCRRFARSHYENFTVASWLIPRALRQHFYNVYAYCRWADDLADETGDSATSLRLLNWWEQQLTDCFAGRATHPVFVALRETIDEFAIPIEPFADLLVAFRQDQVQLRYDTFEDLLGYCRNSANPVGRLVLYLGRSYDETNAKYSDSICTGLQLANFCQDVARDWQRGRIYFPQDDCRQFGYDEVLFGRQTANDEFRALMEYQVDRAERWLRAGDPLADRVGRPLQVDVRLFQRGGLMTLAAIRRQNYDVWKSRPTVGKWTKLGLLLGAIRDDWMSDPQPTATAGER